MQRQAAEVISHTRAILLLQNLNQAGGALIKEINFEINNKTSEFCRPFYLPTAQIKNSGNTLLHEA